MINNRKAQYESDYNDEDEECIYLCSHESKKLVNILQKEKMEVYQKKCSST